MYQLILIRHAETETNVQGRWQGQRCDGTVTPKGRRQIEALARRLDPEKEQVVALYTSPLGRARQTAAALGASLRAGINHLLEWPPAIVNSYRINNCSLTRLVYEYEQWRLATLNDTCHLSDLDD
jgi:broad specificity phosphatase PhoE